MAKRKKRKSRRVVTARGAAVALVFVVMAVSIWVRWSRSGRGTGETGRRFQIEVLNGTGEQGVALETTRKLRMMGIDVKIEGNADRFDYGECLLVDRKGDPGLIEELSKRIGCSRTIQQIQEKPAVDATLIIGRDREKLDID